MQSRFFLFLIAFLAFALCAIATPIPHDDAVIKKALKQYQIKRRDGSTPVKRQYDGFGKPSGSVIGSCLHDTVSHEDMTCQLVGPGRH